MKLRVVGITVDYDYSEGEPREHCRVELQSEGSHPDADPAVHLVMNTNMMDARQYLVGSYYLLNLTPASR